jgi:poly(A) polymerase
MSAQTTPPPDVIDASTLSLSQQDFPAHATQIVLELQEHGYSAYIVGGGVRDLLLGKTPKDFDVATSAPPEEIKSVFGSRCRIIGRRFRLAHVRAGRQIIEVATFRGHHAQSSDSEAQAHAPSAESADELGNRRYARRSGRNDADHLPSGVQSRDGLVLRDNVYGSIEEDALRRDFTINALYYDPQQHAITDYTQGLADIQARTLRLIGDPQRRYREDPVRLIRAVRLSQKLELSVAPGTLDHMQELAPLLHQVPAARLFDEMLKLFLSGHASASFAGVLKYDLLEILLPSTALAAKDQPEVLKLIQLVMHNTDARLAINKPVTPAFLFAALLWYPVLAQHKRILEKKLPFFPALHRAMDEAIAIQAEITSIPKRFSRPMQEIWELQFRLARRTKQRIMKSLQHPRFRAGYDLLLLREEAGEIQTDLGPWWTEFQFATKERQSQMIAELSTSGTTKGKKRKKNKSGAKAPKEESETAKGYTTPVNTNGSSNTQTHTKR